MSVFDRVPSRFYQPRLTRLGQVLNRQMRHYKTVISLLLIT